MIKKLYITACSVRDFVSRKTFQRVFLFVSTFGVMLFAMDSALAVDDDFSVGIGEVYEDAESMKLSTTGPGNDADLTNVTQVAAVTTGTLRIAVGTDRIEPMASAIPQPNQSYLTRRGLLGVSDDAVNALLYNPPTENVYHHLAQEWVPGYDSTDYATYAQDSGYQYLVDVGMSDLWQKTRNIAYLIFVAVMIVVGFMIMFRQKIGGQMAVTVFNTIPNILVSLILVTFSFAIVGLMMNMGALLVRVVAGILGLGVGEGIIVDGPLALVGDLLGLGGTLLFSGVGIGGLLVTGLLGLTGIGAIVTILASLIALIIIGIIIMASLKVFFTLLMAYLNILIDTVLGPLYLAFASLPGQEKLRGDWLRRLAKNILTFPVVFLFVNLGLYLIDQGVGLSFPKGLVGGNITTGSSGGGVLLYVVAIYLMFLAAESPKILDDFLPQSGGKGAQAALQGAMKSIPILKGLAG